MMSFSACHRLLHLNKKNVENDNEPRGSLSSFTTEAKQPRTTTSRDPGSSSSSAHEEKNQEMMITS